MLYNSNNKLLKLGYAIICKTAEEVKPDIVFDMKFDFAKMICIDLSNIIQNYTSDIENSAKMNLYYHKDSKLAWIFRRGRNLNQSSAVANFQKENDYKPRTKIVYQSFIEYIFDCYDYVEFCSKSLLHPIDESLSEFENIVKKFVEDMTHQFDKFNNEDIIIQSKINNLTEQDWRPPEAVGEDYYAV